MKKYLNLVIVVLVIGMSFASCSKSEDVPPVPPVEDGRLNVQVSEWYLTNPPMITQPVSVVVTLKCDAAPKLTFDCGDRLALLSPVSTPTAETLFIYSGEEVPVTWKDGEARAEFYYVALAPGEHSVGFRATYSYKGVSKTDNKAQVLTAVDNDAFGFRPLPVYVEGRALNIAFRDEKDMSCEVEVAVMTFNDSATWGTKEVRIATTYVMAGQYVILPAAKWNETLQRYSGQPVAFDECAYDVDNRAELTFRDKFRRCRKVSLTFNVNKDVVECTVGEYYLQKNQ